MFLGAVRRGLQQDPRRICEENDSVLGLGELAQLTVNNDAEAAYDVIFIIDAFLNFSAPIYFKLHFISENSKLYSNYRL